MEAINKYIKLKKEIAEQRKRLVKGIQKSNLPIETKLKIYEKLLLE